MDDRIKQIAEHYGFYNQAQKCCEECAELIQALCKFQAFILADPVCSGSIIRQAETTPRQLVIEEMADVSIMIKQMRLFLDVSDEVIDQEINRKLTRQMKRMEEESYENEE